MCVAQLNFVLHLLWLIFRLNECVLLLFMLKNYLL